MAKKANPNLVTAILYILVGALLIIFKGGMIDIAMTIAGAFFVISGILDIVKKNYTSGGVSLAIGLAIIILGWVATAIVLLVLGILIAVKGILALVEVLKAKKPRALDLVFPIATAVVGLGIAFGNGVDIILVICGVLLAVDGVLGLVAEFKK